MEQQRGMTAALSDWVCARFGTTASLRAIDGAIDADAGDKGFGYGKPVCVELTGAAVSKVVVHVAKGSGFGHDTLADRAYMAVLPWETFAGLPAHVRPLDVGFIDASGALHSMSAARDFYFVTSFAEGRPYFHDLDVIAHRGSLSVRDLARVRMLVDNLVEIHAEARDDAEAWRRRVRDLFGHSECIAGLLDSYESEAGRSVLSAARCLSIEQRCVRWRSKLRPMSHRLRRVHGDYHPWNILFAEHEGIDSLALLDRSRGAWGDPADDLAALSINYLLYALRTAGTFDGPFAELWHELFARYLSRTGDRELLVTIVPQLVWRALVVASPVWFPHYAKLSEAPPVGADDDAVRASIMRLVDVLLDGEGLDVLRPLG